MKNLDIKPMWPLLKFIESNAILVISILSSAIVGFALYILLIAIQKGF